MDSIYTPVDATVYGKKINRVKPLVVQHLPLKISNTLDTTDEDPQLFVRGTTLVYYVDGNFYDVGGGGGGGRFGIEDTSAPGVDRQIEIDTGKSFYMFCGTSDYSGVEGEIYLSAGLSSMYSQLDATHDGSVTIDSGAISLSSKVDSIRIYNISDAGADISHTSLLLISSYNSGATSIGFGTEIVFQLSTINSLTLHTSGAISSNWTDSDDSTYTAEMGFWTTGSAVSARRMAIHGDGSLVLDNYGGGSISGTPTYSLAVDAGGNVIEVPLPIGGMIYSAKLSQGGTSNPSVVEINNATGGTVTWARGSAGNFTTSSGGAFAGMTYLTSGNIGTITTDYGISTFIAGGELVINIYNPSGLAGIDGIVEMYIAVFDPNLALSGGGGGGAATAGNGLHIDGSGEVWMGGEFDDDYFTCGKMPDFGAASYTGYLHFDYDNAGGDKIAGSKLGANAWDGTNQGHSFLEFYDDITSPTSRQSIASLHTEISDGDSVLLDLAARNDIAPTATFTIYDPGIGTLYIATPLAHSSTIGTRYFAISVNGTFADNHGNVTISGITWETFQTLTVASTTTWDTDVKGHNTKFTINQDITFSVTNDADGEEGNCYITQDGTGGWLATVPSGDRVADGAAVVGSPDTLDISSGAGATTLVSYIRVGSIRLWTKNVFV